MYPSRREAVQSEDTLFWPKQVQPTSRVDFRSASLEIRDFNDIPDVELAGLANALELPLPESSDELDVKHKQDLVRFTLGTLAPIPSRGAGLLPSRGELSDLEY